MIGLKIATLRKGLWYDKDTILLHATFQLLVDYVEQEKPAKRIDWNWDTRHRRAWKEIMSLYCWWKKERPARKSVFEGKRVKYPVYRSEKIPGTNYTKWVQPDKKKYTTYYRLLKQEWKQEAKWHMEDQRNLHRLIEIRDHLWT